MIRYLAGVLLVGTPKNPCLRNSVDGPTSSDRSDPQRHNLQVQFLNVIVEVFLRDKSELVAGRERESEDPLFGTHQVDSLCPFTLEYLAKRVENSVLIEVINQLTLLRQSCGVGVNVNVLPMPCPALSFAQSSVSERPYLPQVS